MSHCRWCGKMIRKDDNRVCVDSQLKLYDHLKCNEDRFISLKKEFPDWKPAYEQKTLGDGF